MRSGLMESFMSAKEHSEAQEHHEQHEQRENPPEYPATPHMPVSGPVPLVLLGTRLLGECRQRDEYAAQIHAEVSNAVHFHLHDQVSDRFRTLERASPPR